MKHDQTSETASGTGYERQMARIKAETRFVLREPVSFKKDRGEAVETDNRPQFGKRRTFEL